MTQNFIAINPSNQMPCIQAVSTIHRVLRLWKCLTHFLLAFHDNSPFLHTGIRPVVIIYI